MSELARKSCVPCNFRFKDFKATLEFVSACGKGVETKSWNGTSPLGVGGNAIRLRVVQEVMVRRHLRVALGCSLVLGLSAIAAAASLDLHKAKEKTKELTRRNATTLIRVSSAVPDEVRIEVIEIVQGLELSRDRIILFLDRIDEGVLPAEEGVRRATAVANATAEKEREFLEALMKRVPAPALPKVEEALAVSSESWKGILSSLQISQKAKEPDLPSRPRLDLYLLPGSRPPSDPPSE